MPDMFGIVTSCSSRKRSSKLVARLDPSDLQGGVAKVAARWLQIIAATPSVATAGELYLGRAMLESKAVAAYLNGTMHVISAGMGLAAQDDHIPAYDLTVASREGPLGSILSQAGASPADWWELLNDLRASSLPLSGLINHHERTRFLLALPSNYLAMVCDDLNRVHDNALDRLYIFTSLRGARTLPRRLLRCLLPYDERLEGHPAHAGTRSDFPQRAMRHFVERLAAHSMRRQEAREAVEEAMNSLTKPSIPQRARKSDGEILEIVRAQWGVHAGNSDRLHRYLRDTALVACEQRRFGGLWRQVKGEFNETSKN